MKNHINVFSHLHNFRRHKINLHDFTLTQMDFIHLDRPSVAKISLCHLQLHTFTHNTDGNPSEGHEL